MLVFIDESGDAGFKIGSGSTRYLVVTCVIFEDPLEAERAAVGLKLLRRQLKWRDDAEFHFNKASSEVKRAFFAEAIKYGFKIRAIVIDKTELRSEDLRTNRAYFYNYAIRLVLHHSNGQITNAKIRLDGRGDRTYKRGVGSYLRTQLNQGPNKIINQFKMVDSKENILIQLADMVSGAVYMDAEGTKKNSSEYIDLLKSHVSDIWWFK